MCGLAGFSSIASEVSHTWVVKTRELLTHRGPDGYGQWFSQNGKDFVSHTRLAIIDRSEAGRQPFTCASEKLTLVFNGEIYNHKEIRRAVDKHRRVKWRTKTDTETLAEAIDAFGVEKTLELARGMYAFAVVWPDKIVLARDPAGQKPLYYYHENQQFIFASELKVLLNYPGMSRILNPRTVGSLLHHGYAEDHDCITIKHKKVKPGELIKFNKVENSIEKKIYWKTQELQAHPEMKANEYVVKTEDLLSNAIREQLEADTDVGILLSGGLDSSLITALASRYAPNIRTFTVTFESQEHNEASHSRLVSDTFKTTHTEILCTNQAGMGINYLSRYLDEPIIDSSILAASLCYREASKFCKVLIGGDGADELFGGYKHYQRLLRRDIVCHLLHNPIREVLSGIGKRYPDGKRGKALLTELGMTYDDLLPQTNKLMGENTIRRLSDEVAYHFVSRVCKQRDTSLSTHNRLSKLLENDFKGYLPGCILAKVDRASMLNSVEARSPFLDERIIRFCQEQIPMKYLVTVRARKKILQALAYKLLPRDFNRTRKLGFDIPVASWGNSGEFEKTMIELGDTTIFNKSALFELIEKCKDLPYLGEAVFGTLLLESWVKENGCSF